MKGRFLQPEQLIVPAEYELGNESILKIYFRIMAKGHSKDLPPCIVTHKNRIEADYLRERYSNKKTADEFYQELMDTKAEYLLLDGNHKAVAAALCRCPISSLELQADEDIQTARRMAEKGKLFDFPHEENSLTELANEFIDFLYSPGMKIVMTIEERVVKLVSNGDLPEYMKERYLRES